MNRKKWLVGVDEAGRGPLAGPVAVGVVKVPVDFDWCLLPGVGDSKKVAPGNREAIARHVRNLRYHRQLDFSVSQVGPSVIDNRGIVFAVNLAIQRCFKRLNLNEDECKVLLDGALRAPSNFSQTTIIKGDALEPVIGLASILAKVTRDKYMVRIDKRFPGYDFATHKGYGTKSHRAIIAKRGRSPIHRFTFCQNIG